MMAAAALVNVTVITTMVLTEMWWWWWCWWWWSVADRPLVLPHVSAAVVVTIRTTFTCP
jgi:hypothetical protein